jgi:hypothetical protein
MTAAASSAATMEGSKSATSGFARARVREAEVAAVLAELLQDFRSPSVTERMLLEQMASEVVRSRRARAIGRAKEASDAARLVSRIASQLGARRDRRPGADTSARDELGAYLAEAHAEPAEAPSEPEGGDRT